ENVVRITCFHLFSSAILYEFLNFLPVKGYDEVLVILGGVDFQKGVGFFGIIGGGKDPAVGSIASGVVKIKVEARHNHLESALKTSWFLVYLYNRKRVFQVPFHLVERNISLGRRNGKSGSGNKILTVLGDGKTLVSRRVWEL